MKKSNRGFPLYLLMIMVVFAVWQMFTSSMNEQVGARIEYSEMLSHIQAGAIEQVAVREDTIFARIVDSRIPEDMLILWRWAMRTRLWIPAASWRRRAKASRSAR